MKPWIRYALTALFFTLVGYGFARHNAPDRATAETVVKTVEVESKEARATIAALREQIAQTKRHTFRTEVTTKKPDGTVTTTKTEDEHLQHDTQSKDLTSSVAESKELATKAEDRKHLTVTERSRPDWRIGPQIDFNLRTGAVGYGASVERRILGPLSLRVSASSSGTVSAGISIEF